MIEENKEINKKYILSKLILVVLFLVLVALNSKYGFLLPKGINTCVYDATFNWTITFNQFYNKNAIIKNMIMVLSSILQDFIFVYFLLFFINEINTFRPLIALSLFISCKLICQVNF